MAFVAASQRASQSGQTSSAVTVPAGTAIGQIAVVDFFTNPSTITPTPPANFTLQTAVNLAAGSRTAKVSRFWKRLTAADSGSYTFTTTSAITKAICTLWSGRATTGDPFDSALQTNTAPSGVTTAVACPDLNITPTVAGVDLVYGVVAWTGPLTSNTISQSFVDASRNATNSQIIAYKANQPASATGNVNTSGSDNWIVLLSALLPAVTATPVKPISNNRQVVLRRAANW